VFSLLLFYEGTLFGNTVNTDFGLNTGIMIHFPTRIASSLRLIDAYSCTLGLAKHSTKLHRNGGSPLPEANSSHLKMHGWKLKMSFLLAPDLFSGANCYFQGGYLSFDTLGTNRTRYSK